jgi:hypothetical protein
MSLKSKFENLKEQVENGGRYVRKIGKRKKVWEPFTPEKREDMARQIDRMLKAYNPKYLKLEKDLRCRNTKNDGKTMIECGHVLVKKGNTVMQGRTFHKCIACDFVTEVNVKPPTANCQL